MEYLWNDTDKGKSNYSEKILSQCQFFVQNSHMTNLLSNPDLRGEQRPEPYIS